MTNLNKLTLREKVVLPMVLFLVFFIGILFLGVQLVKKPDIRGAVFIDPSTYVTTTGFIKKSYNYTYRSVRTNWKSSAYAIEYSYAVNGKTFQSGVLTFDMSCGIVDELSQLYTEKYPIGNSVQVFYLPDEPAFSVLEPHRKGLTPYFFWSIIGISLFCFSAIGRLLWLRWKKEQEKTAFFNDANLWKEKEFVSWQAENKR